MLAVGSSGRNGGPGQYLQPWPFAPPVCSLDGFVAWRLSSLL